MEQPEQRPIGRARSDRDQLAPADADLPIRRRALGPDLEGLIDCDRSPATWVHCFGWNGHSDTTTATHKSCGARAAAGGPAARSDHPAVALATAERRSEQRSGTDSHHGMEQLESLSPVGG